MTSEAGRTRHPSLKGRVARGLRELDRLPGWRRISYWLTPMAEGGAFRVNNRGTLFSGDVSSFVEREIYLFGAYEAGMIATFLGTLQPASVILDVGANVGTHSIAFAKSGAEVHAFEPNPALWANFERNVSINGLDRVCLHRVGLGAVEAELPFFITDHGNKGLGTFVGDTNYGRPLREMCKARIAVGDEVVTAGPIGSIGGVKIDVQGFEPDVLRGLAGTLARHRPVVWVEIGGATRDALNTTVALAALFPYPVDILRMIERRRGWGRRTTVEPVVAAQLPRGDLLVRPSAPWGLA